MPTIIVVRMIDMMSSSVPLSQKQMRIHEITSKTMDSIANATLCAIGALGVAGMFGTDITVSSPCRHCGKAVYVKTTDEGQAL